MSRKKNYGIEATLDENGNLLTPPIAVDDDKEAMDIIIQMRNLECDYCVMFASRFGDVQYEGREYGEKEFTMREVLMIADRLDVKADEADLKNFVRRLTRAGQLMKEPKGKTYRYNPEFDAPYKKAKEELDFLKSQL